MDDLLVLADGTYHILQDTFDGAFENQDYIIVTEKTTFGELMNMTPEIQAGVIEYLTAGNGSENNLAAREIYAEMD